MLVLAVALAPRDAQSLRRVRRGARSPAAQRPRDHPAGLVCVGLALAIFGSAPKVVYVAWAVLAAFVVVGEFGPLFNLPQPVIDVSPFVHAVVLPGSSVVATPLAVLLAIAAALVVLAQTTFRRRDIG